MPGSNATDARCDHGAYFAQHVSIYPNKLGKLTVRLVNLACSAPKTRGNRHCGEDSIIVEEKAFERFFDEYEVLRIFVSSPYMTVVVHHADVLYLLTILIVRWPNERLDGTVDVIPPTHSELGPQNR